MGPRLRALVFALLAATLVGAAEQAVEHYAQQRNHERERSDTLRRLSALRAGLQRTLNANLFLIRSLGAQIAMRPDLSQQDFVAIASRLADERHALRTLSAAPAMVSRMVYPLEGNEAALGLDYLNQPALRDAALRARDTGRAVVAGPLALAQGGVGIIAREPVFLPAERAGGERRFWGLVSAVIDPDSLYAKAGLTNPELGLQVALRAVDGSATRARALIGEPTLFDERPVTLEIALPGGDWQLAAVPREGWERTAPPLTPFRVIGLLVAFAVAALTWRLTRIAQRLAAHNAELATLLDTIPDLIWLKDADGAYLAANPPFRQAIGKPARELLGRTDDALLSPELAGRRSAQDRAAIEAGAPTLSEERASLPGQSQPVLLETIRAPVRDTDGHLLGVLGIARDITARKRTEAELRESEGRFRSLASVAPVGIFRTDAEGACVYVNPRWSEITGMSLDEARGDGWLESIDEADRDAVLARLRQAASAEEAVYTEYRIRSPGGGATWVIGRALAERDRQGRFGGLVGTVSDISQLKRYEEEIRALNADLEARVRLRTAELDAANKELETFTYSVSHDLKAPLRGIDGYSQLLQQCCEDRLDDEGRLFLANLRQGVAQMNELIDDLLAYSRIERRDLHGQELELARQLEQVLAERRAEIAAHGMLVEVSTGGLSVHADPEGLDLVLRNLLDNAIKFSRHSRPPRLSIDARERDGAVTLSLRDNGIGFDMRFHDRVFEIFQRLQRAEDYPGTGVGLAIAQKAVQRMGGRLWAESAPGQGATFHMELPR